MKISNSTSPVATPSRLAAAALGVAVVGSLAVSASPASASRPETYRAVAATTAPHRVAWDDPGGMLAQRKSLIDPRWWVRLGNLGEQRRSRSGGTRPAAGAARAPGDSLADGAPTTRCRRRIEEFR